MLDKRPGGPRVPVQMLKAGVLYFAIVFGAGFVLGTLRVLWAVPRFGERTAELMESPIMLVVTILAARWVVRRLAIPAAVLPRLGMGLVGLALLLVAELSMVWLVRGLTISEYVASRDLISGTVYLVLLGILAVMPLLAARR
jgi:hypothetical protein